MSAERYVGCRYTKSWEQKPKNSCPYCCNQRTHCIPKLKMLKRCCKSQGLYSHGRRRRQLTRWLATKQDTARHSRVFLQYTSADHSQRRSAGEALLKKVFPPHPLPEVFLFQQSRLKNNIPSCYQTYGVSIFLKSRVMRCAVKTATNEGWRLWIAPSVRGGPAEKSPLRSIFGKNNVSLSKNTTSQIP